MSVFTHSERFHYCSCRPGATSQLRRRNGFYVTSNTKPLKDTEFLHKDGSVLLGTWCRQVGADCTWPFGVCMDVRLECFSDRILWCNKTINAFHLQCRRVLTVHPTGTLPQQFQAKKSVPPTGYICSLSCSSWTYYESLILDWQYGGAAVFSSGHLRYWSQKNPCGTKSIFAIIQNPPPKKTCLGNCDLKLKLWPFIINISYVYS